MFMGTEKLEQTKFRFFSDAVDIHIIVGMKGAVVQTPWIPSFPDQPLHVMYPNSGDFKKRFNHVLQMFILLKKCLLCHYHGLHAIAT